MLDEEKIVRSIDFWDTSYYHKIYYPDGFDCQVQGLLGGPCFFRKEFFWLSQSYELLCI